jgi:hypothetical protein
MPATRGWWLVLLIAVVIWCGNLEYRKLSLSDEGRYSEIPRYMAQSGDWVTPRLNGIKYFEKPPLQYWATAAAYRVFGEHNWTARVWPALTGLLGVVLMYFVGARLYGRTAGLYAAAVLASSVLYAALAHILTLDMGLAFFLTVAYAGLVLALDPRADAAANRRWMHVAAAGCAAVLSKGLIGIVLPGAVIGYTCWERFRLAGRLKLSGGAVPRHWRLGSSRCRSPTQIRIFFHEHLQRSPRPSISATSVVFFIPFPRRHTAWLAQFDALITPQSAPTHASTHVFLTAVGGFHPGFFRRPTALRILPIFRRWRC